MAGDGEDSMSNLMTVTAEIVCDCGHEASLEGRVLGVAINKQNIAFSVVWLKYTFICPKCGRRAIIVSQPIGPVIEETSKDHFAPVKENIRDLIKAARDDVDDNLAQPVKPDYLEPFRVFMERLV
jgi:hypothetical protein